MSIKLISDGLNQFLKLLIVGFIVFLYSISGHASCIGVGCNCTVAAVPVNFGDYDPQGNGVSSTGKVSVTCSALVAGLNVSYIITLNTGSGNYTARKLQGSTAYLNYNLYKDLSHTLIWGDGSANTYSVTDAYILSLLSATREYIIYGYLPGTQNVPADTYSDNITATLTF